MKFEILVNLQFLSSICILLCMYLYWALLQLCETVNIFVCLFHQVKKKNSGLDILLASNEIILPLQLLL